METAQILTDLRVERDRINQAIAALEALNGTVSGTTPRGSGLKSAKATVPESKPSSAKRVVSVSAKAGGTQGGQEERGGARELNER